MYNKNNLAVEKIASRSTIRPEMQCVAFYGNRTVATDSHSLVEMSADGKKLKEPVLLNANLLKGVKLGKDESIELKDIKITPTEERYPDIDNVLDEHDTELNKTRVTINAQYLINVLTTLKSLSKNNTVELIVDTENTRVPVVLKASNDKQKARALVMPLM